MSTICDFDRILKTERNLQHFTRNCRIKNVDDFERDEADPYLWRAGVLNVKEKGMTICYIYEEVFGDVFERRKSKYCAVLMKHRLKVKGEQRITLQMAQQLKPKILMLYQDNYFVVSVKINFCQRQTDCIDDQDKFQPVKDAHSEFTKCQTPRKKLQSIGISSVSLYSFMKTLKSNISESYKVQVDCLKDSESDSYDKNDTKEKVNDLVRLHRQCKKNYSQAT